ncbi:MAG: hypothetical protein Q7Q73_02290 [Verrucomicrobiota bacterium JB024]|nr:hypothetical protein [Verrucomicrobiota bacterium JB024]
MPELAIPRHLSLSPDDFVDVAISLYLDRLVKVARSCYGDYEDDELTPSTFEHECGEAGIDPGATYTFFDTLSHWLEHFDDGETDHLLLYRDRLRAMQGYSTGGLN